MKRIKNIIPRAIVFCLALLPALSRAQDGSVPHGTDVQNNLDDAAVNGAGYNIDAHTGTSLASYLGKVAEVFVSFIGVLFVIYTIYGGFMWMTASGNQERVDKARKTITQGVIGVIVVLSAAAIYLFIKNVLVFGVRSNI